MSIVVGYVPRREGLAALEAAVAEALRRNEPLVVVNAGADADPFGSGLAERRDLEAMCRPLADAGVSHEIRQPRRGLSPADELLVAVEDSGARLLVLGPRDHRHPRAGHSDSTVVRLLLEADCDVLLVRFAGV
ncbi:MAG: universal stress protein [Micrococcales bacterium]|nr:universal stress protein [Micrococcales bacterium]